MLGVVILAIRCWQSGGGTACDMGELRTPGALIGAAYVIGFLALALGIYLVVRGRLAHRALLRRIGQGRPLRLTGLTVVLASALMLVNARALDLVSRHIQLPAPFGLIQIAGAPLVLGAILGLQWHQRRTSRSGAPPTGGVSAPQP